MLIPEEKIAVLRRRTAYFSHCVGFILFNLFHTFNELERYTIFFHIRTTYSVIFIVRSLLVRNCLKFFLISSIFYAKIKRYVDRNVMNQCFCSIFIRLRFDFVVLIFLRSHSFLRRRLKFISRGVHDPREFVKPVYIRQKSFTLDRIAVNRANKHEPRVYLRDRKKRKQFSLATEEQTTNFSNIASQGEGLGSYPMERSNLARAEAPFVFLLGRMV